MKNNYLVRFALLAVALFMCASLQAQTTILFQNFETSKTTIPAGWTQQQAAADPSNLGWEFNNTFPTSGAIYTYIAKHTYYAFVDDYDNNTSVVANSDTLYTPMFSCAGQNHVFVSFDLMYYIYNGYETANLAISTNGGKTWATVTDSAGLPTNGFTWQDSLVYDISAYAANKDSVMLAFTYFDGVPNIYGAPGVGIALDNVDVFAPLSYDLGVTSQNLPYLMQVGIPYTFTGTIENFGGDSVVSMHLNYSVNGGAAQSDNITGIIGFSGLTTYNFTHSIPFTPTAAGAYTIKFWADNLNGTNVDQNHKNDTLTAKFLAIDSIQPKMALLEEFMNASCDPCMYATPNVDSVSANNLAMCNAIRYHVWFPGRDFMDDETYTPFVDARATYYTSTVLDQGVPDAQLDGQYFYPGYGYLSSASVRQTASTGSPFAISITSATYSSSTNTFALSAKITSYGAFPAGIIAQVVLSVDTISYSFDQSQEDPQVDFQPPIGSTSAASGGINDSLYPGLLNFPDVAEDMMPSSSGTSLAAFTSGSNQTINVSWKVNHPWGSNPKGSTALGDTSVYDSTQAVKFTVFLQDTKGEPTLGVPAHYVYQSASAQVNYVLGLQEISNGVSFDMYPNPTTANTNIVYDIAQEQNVNIAVFNLLGEKVFTADLGKTGAGRHSYMIDGTGLQSGVYMVKFSTDNATTTQRLVIQK